MQFYKLLLAFGCVAIAWACTPTTSTTTVAPTTTPTTAAPTTTPTTTPTTVVTTSVNASGGTGRKKRQADQVQLTVVTEKVYSSATLQDNMRIIAKTIDECESNEGIKYDESTLHKVAKNQNGKFAVVYTFNDACNRVQNFVNDCKGLNDDFSYAIFKCNGRTTFL